MLKELRDLLEMERRRAWTVCLVILKEVDLVKYRATIQPKTRVFNTSSKSFVELPEIKDCPILTPRGAHNSLVFAPSVGDVGIGVFSYLPLDGQLKDRQMEDEKLRRRQSYPDAFVFVGLLLDDEELPDIKENEIHVLHTDKEGKSNEYQRIRFVPNGDIRIYSTEKPDTFIDITFSEGNIEISTETDLLVNTGRDVIVNAGRDVIFNTGRDFIVNAQGRIILNALLGIEINSGTKLKLQGGGKPLARRGDRVDVNLETGRGTITGGSSSAESG